MPATCGVCSKTFSAQKKLTRHLKTHDVKDPVACQLCTRMLKDVNSLRRHVERAHPQDDRSANADLPEINTESADGKTSFSCPFCEKADICDFPRLKHHVVTDHGHHLPQQDLRFGSYEDAKKWVESLCKTDKAQYCQLNGRRFRKDGSFSQVWVCRRSGELAHVTRSYELGADNQKARPYQKPSCKLTTACSSRILMEGLAEGGVHVEFYDSHSGHDPNADSVGFLRLPKSTIFTIQVQLEQGVPPKNIVAACNAPLRDRNRRNELSQAPSRDMFVTLQDVYNVKSKFNVLANLGHREAIGVDILVQELMKEDHNPVLLYKPSGVDDNTGYGFRQQDFFLGLQTEFMSDSFQQFGSRLIGIDSTHNTTHFGMKLITGLVVDPDNNLGIPVAFAIVSRENSVSLRALHDVLKKKHPHVDIRFHISDDDNTAWNEARRVWPNLMHFLCVWHVDRNWRRQLLAKCSQKDNCKRMYQHLSVLRIDRDKERFYKMISWFRNFWSGREPEALRYLEEHYFNRPEQWSLAFRSRDLPDTTGHNEAVHNVLKYVYFAGRVGTSVPKLIDILLEYEKDVYAKVLRLKHCLGAESVTSSFRRSVKKMLQLDPKSVAEAVGSEKRTFVVPSKDKQTSYVVQCLESFDADTRPVCPGIDHDFLSSSRNAKGDDDDHVADSVPCKIWETCFACCHCFSCTCPYYLRGYTCKHILLVALSLGFWSPMCLSGTSHAHSASSNNQPSITAEQADQTCSDLGSEFSVHLKRCQDAFAVITSKMEEVANLRDPSVMQAQAMRDLAMQLHRACIKFDIVLESYPGSTPNFGERIECYGTQARFQKQLRFESSAPSRKRRNPPPLEKPTGKDFDFIQREMCQSVVTASIASEASFPNSTEQTHGSSMPDYQEVVDDDNDETHMGTSFVHASADMFTSCFVDVRTVAPANHPVVRFISTLAQYRPLWLCTLPRFPGRPLSDDPNETMPDTPRVVSEGQVLVHPFPSVVISSEDLRVGDAVCITLYGRVCAAGVVCGLPGARFDRGPYPTPVAITELEVRVTSVGERYRHEPLPFNVRKENIEVLGDLQACDWRWIFPRETISHYIPESSLRLYIPVVIHLRQRPYYRDVYRQVKCSVE